VVREEREFHFNSAGYQKGRNQRSNRRFITVLCGPRLPGCYVLAHVFLCLSVKVGDSGAMGKEEREGRSG
jgi:hypothetical protein